MDLCKSRVDVVHSDMFKVMKQHNIGKGMMCTQTHLKQSNIDSSTSRVDDVYSDTFRVMK